MNETSRVLTIGYGNRALGQFYEVLEAFEVTHLVDVRSAPYSSYRKEFDREALTERHASGRVRYVYLGNELGAIAVAENGEALVRGLRRVFESALKPSVRICLMCGCLRPERCHRGSALAPMLEALGLEVRHIDEFNRAVATNELAVQPVLF